MQDPKLLSHGLGLLYLVLVSLLLPPQGELPRALLALFPLCHSNIYCRGMFNSKLHGQKEPLAACIAHFHYGAFQTQGHKDFN